MLLYSRCLSEITLSRDKRERASLGAHCSGRYPWAIEGCREYFSADVVTAVDIGVDGSTSFDAVPAAISASREAWVLLLFGPLGRIVCWEYIAIRRQLARLA